MIRFLGDTAVRGGGGGQRAAYEQHTRQSLRKLDAAAASGAQRLAQAQQQQATTSAAVERAETAVSQATTRRDIDAALRSVAQSLDRARRAGGDRSALLKLERTVEALRRSARDKEHQLAQQQSGRVAPGAVLEAARATTPPQHNRLERQALGVSSEPLRKAEGREWYSKHHPRSGSEVMFDKNGQPTLSYPHVHVIHDERAGEVRVVLSLGRYDHPEKLLLPGDASGNDVNAAVEVLRRKL